MSGFTWSLESITPEPLSPEDAAYVARAERNRRFQCGCGRFVKSATVRRRAYPLDYDLQWDCSRCGPCSG